ncbi:hypothetical protein ACHAWF_012412 [Thalassiosira exigua]
MARNNNMSLGISSGSDSTGVAIARRSRDPVNPYLKGSKYVIFPQNVWIQAWDFLVIVSIWYYSFYIPFHFGISLGYYTVMVKSFSIFNTVLNVVFLLDTFLHFFRAYRDKDGHIVFCLKTIQRSYIRSGWFFVNILASLPATTLFYSQAREMLENGGDVSVLAESNLRAYFILESFKLLRLLRIKRIMMTSEVMTRSWERLNIESTLVLKFVFMITVASHWIACIWGLIAFQEAGSFGAPLLQEQNWISGWVNATYGDSGVPNGALNPIGFSNAIPRYWLCLFWAIQSITSIGYGNIVPVTSIEYGFANALMLLCGIFWAYIIGNLVEVVQNLGSTNKEYISHMTQANKMMADFTSKNLDESVVGTIYSKSTNKRVRRFITNQRDTGTKTWADSSDACTLESAYPTLSILSPELRRVCALHLAHSLLEAVPYLSSKFLSPEEQAYVALKCVDLEFSSSEKFVAHPEHGRGILIFRKGYALTSRNIPGRRYVSCYKDILNRPLDVNEVLVEDDFFREHHLIFHFIGFTKVFFVPRSVIVEVLEKNQRAWKCARWRYFIAKVVLHSLKDSGEADSFYDCL